MKISEQKYFELLKSKIVDLMQKSYPGISNSVVDWKGQNIIDFQHELHVKQNQHISEKWFYTHMKSNNSKLPRIDILNFLSEYVGYKNWEEFKLENSNPKNGSATDKSNRVFYLVPLLVLIVLSVFYFISKWYYTQEYTFCFYDSVSKIPITNSSIEISVLSKKESPKNYLCTSEGCFTIKTNKRTLEFIVETPYYYTDTIVRKLNSFNRSEKIKLRLDDYAVMIQYFSTSNVKDWLKRKKELDLIFSDNAKIFQVVNGTVGVEMYNKWEFINKLTLPSNGLRDIEILDAQYKDEKISHLRFKQNEKDK